MPVLPSYATLTFNGLNSDMDFYQILVLDILCVKSVQIRSFGNTDRKIGKKHGPGKTS